MRRKLLNILCILVVALSITRCGTVYKTLKSGDHQQIYQQALLFYEQEEWGRASTLFEAVEHLYTGTTREDSVSYFIARSKAKSGDYYSALDILDSFRREFGRSVFIEDAEAMYAMCYYYLSPGPSRDQATTQRAISSIYEFMSRYPDSEKNATFLEIIDELQGRLYDKSYINAYTYYKIGKYKSAIVAFRNAMKEYPMTTHREDLSYHIVASSYELAKNSIPSKQEDRYIALLDSYYTFIAEFPESEYLKSATKMAESAKKYLSRIEVEHHEADNRETNPEEEERILY